MNLVRKVLMLVLVSVFAISFSAADVFAAKRVKTAVATAGPGVFLKLIGPESTVHVESLTINMC